jgi:hypothetical protein
MWKTKLNAITSAVPAIAAALALSSTPALAQQAQTPPTDAAPATSADQATPAPVTDSAPAAPDASVAAPETSTVATPVVDTKAASTTAQKTVKRTSRTTLASPAPKAPVRVATHSATVQKSPSATPAAAPVKQSTAATTQTSASAVQPVVDLNSKPATTAAAKPSKKHDDTLPIAGGALAFLAIGGAAIALTRRRHDHEEEWVDDGLEHDTVDPAAAEHTTYKATNDPIVHEEQPAMIAPAASAFSWGEEQRRQDASTSNAAVTDEDDRLPGETWIQRAYRGPSSNNPSVSLRARLKRAAFFDKRERDVAAGKAEPVEMDAGLPEAMVEEQEEREFA